jgi:predicted kinase
MEMILFIGMQASGKSTFYKERFFDSHVRISMDLLRTRNRERIFIQTCLSTQQRLVVDNTNPTRAERARYRR